MGHNDLNIFFVELKERDEHREERWVVDLQPAVEQAPKIESKMYTMS